MSSVAGTEGAFYLEELCEAFDSDFQAIADQGLVSVRTSPTTRDVVLHEIDGVGRLLGRNLRAAQHLVRVTVYMDGYNPKEGFYKDFRLTADILNKRYFHRDMTPAVPRELVDTPWDPWHMMDTIKQLSEGYVLAQRSSEDMPLAEVIDIREYRH